MKPLVYRHSAVLALAITSFAGGAAAGSVGSSENFEGDPVGSFPTSWSDVGAVDPDSTVPIPSSVVVSTVDAFGNPTKAVVTLPKVVGTLPTTAPTQGIYRSIAIASFYSTLADVRIDRFGDASDFDCGCIPPELRAGTDWPMQVGFAKLIGTSDLAIVPSVALLASSRTHNWRLFVYTENVQADYDLGLPITLGRWYGTQIDLDPSTGAVHSRITDAASGLTLVDSITLLPSSWDPAVDGRLDLAAYFGGDGTALTTSGLATIDNISVRNNPIPEPPSGALLGSLLVVGAVVCRRRASSWGGRMTAIVHSTYRYKRPPKRRKTVALEASAPTIP
jgi:hypothetical protein